MNSCYVFYDPNDIYIKNRVTWFQSDAVRFEKSIKCNWDYVFINSENMLNITTHCDYLFWKVINVGYTSEIDAAIVEMNDLEKEYVKKLLSGVEVKPKKYLIKEYNDNGYSLKKTYYCHDNGDGTYTGKIEEITYTYSEINLNILESHNVITYYLDGTERTNEIFNYYTNEEGSLIIKREE